MNVTAVRDRVADTLRRDEAVKGAVKAVVVGDTSRPEYGDDFPLVRVSVSRAPISRRAVGTPRGPNRHAPQEVRCAVEALVVTAEHATALEAQDAAWALVGLVESALARNRTLVDADGANPLVHTLELKSVRYLGARPGGAREVLNVAVMAVALEDVGEVLISAEPEAEGGEG